jgi:hypothetical protein
MRVDVFPTRDAAGMDLVGELERGYRQPSSRSTYG